MSTCVFVRACVCACVPHTLTQVCMPVCMQTFMPMCVGMCAFVYVYIYILCVCVCACKEITGFLVSGFLNSLTDWLLMGLDGYRNYTMSAASSFFIYIFIYFKQLRAP